MNGGVTVNNTTSVGISQLVKREQNRIFNEFEALVMSAQKSVETARFGTLTGRALRDCSVGLTVAVNAVHVAAAHIEQTFNAHPEKRESADAVKKAFKEARRIMTRTCKAGIGIITRATASIHAAPVRIAPRRKESPVRTSSTEAARHRESDDTGGDDDGDDDPARVHHIQRQRVLAVLLEGRSINRFEAIDLGWNIQKTTLPGRFASYFIAAEDNLRPLARKEADR